MADSIYDAANDADIDDFFNFREIKRAPDRAASSASSRTNSSVPKIKKTQIKTPRNVSGTGYVKQFNNVIEKNLTKVILSALESFSRGLDANLLIFQSFSGLNLTGLSSGIPIDDSALFDTISYAGEVELPHSDHRNDLPIYRYRDEIIRNIRSHPSKFINFTGSFFYSNLFLF
jgi:hypothetical protein